MMSVNSYGYSGQSYLQGPVLNSETQMVYDAAQTALAGANTIVP